jgi:mannitol/fructose-specific phosphotransferase system IIA component (Ntr-type)/DNA-directed RNA polymerase subunit RPC12/RpoP
MVRKERHTIKHLIQLQDLVAARAQQLASMPSQRLQQLEKSIKTLDDELPIELKTHFNRLLQKSIEAIVPITGGKCSGCGFALTKTMVNSVAAGDELNRCPNCTRILYKPDVPLTRRSPRRRWGDPVKRGVERFSAPELMIASLKGTTKEEILQEMCENLRAEGYIENCTDLHDAALRREAIVPTAVEHGIAFPHVRGVEGGGLTLTLGISKKGVVFGGDKRSKIFFYMVIPTAASAFYLKLLSGLTQSFATKEALDSLLNAKTQEELWKALTKATKKMIQ